jgi:hypothetical protein
VRQGPGAQEAKPLCACRRLVRLGPNSQRHCPRAIALDQCSHHPLEPCSYRTSSSTETNTVPLVVVCSARGRCVVPNTEGLHGLLSCALLPWCLRGGETRKEGFRGVAIRNCLNKTMPLIHPIMPSIPLPLFRLMDIEQSKVTFLYVGDKRSSHFETCPRHVRDVAAVLTLRCGSTAAASFMVYVLESQTLCHVSGVDVCGAHCQGRSRDNKGMGGTARGRVYITTQPL